MHSRSPSCLAPFIAAAALACVTLPGPPPPPPAVPQPAPKPGLAVVVLPNPDQSQAQSNPWLIAEVDLGTRSVKCHLADQAGLSQFLPPSGKAGCTGTSCSRMTLFVDPAKYQSATQGLTQKGLSSSSAGLSGADPCSGNPVGGSGGGKGLNGEQILQLAESSDRGTQAALGSE